MVAITNSPDVCILRFLFLEGTVAVSQNQKRRRKISLLDLLDGSLNRFGSHESFESRVSTTWARKSSRESGVVSPLQTCDTLVTC